MNPLFAGRLRQALYFTVWVGIGALLAAVLIMFQPRPLGQAALFVAPLTLFYAFACLSAWWVCRANPLATTPPERLVAVVASASVLASLLWVITGALWSAALQRLGQGPPGRGPNFRGLGVPAIAGV